MNPRHLTSINDLSQGEIEGIFSLASQYLRELADPDIPYRIAASSDVVSGSIMAALFYEPSTRTRLSFESAMLRLGGKTISSTDSAASSVSKGESLADTIRMVCGYADVVVLRHRRDGAARFAARYATVPLINAGDGAHEHPTQTLCDLFTILCERGSLNNLTVALLGDLKGGRTAHSLAYALARYGANLVCMPAKGLDLPEHVASTLRASFGYRYVDANSAGRGYDRMTGVFVPQDADTPALDAIDVLYVTRFQKERATETAADYPTVNAAFLAPDGFRNTLVLHPLPRVGELDPKFDADARAGYFRQACYGVPVRMALLTYLLKTKGDNILSNPHHDAENEHRGTACGNPNCISHDSNEPEATPRLAPSRDQPSRLRCLYCDQETPTA